ncbi:ferredoxin [Corynebacterium sp. A21]|uniref:ferredoxin n=1 Tax=Corynebacterium sp. A21 TaxID=3457318 RepID=UPI003FD0DB53
MKVTVNHDSCVASGNCGYLAPEVFRNLDEHDGFVSLLNKNPPESEWPAVRKAERLCPSGTIFITDDAPQDPTDPPH